MAARLLVERRDAVLLLRISNPGARNAMHPDIYRAGAEALKQATTDESIRALVLAGDGEHFCAGGNLHRLLENRAKDRSVQAASIDLMHRWILAIRDCPKPVIAAVEGAAAGAGFSLVLACDQVVAASDARFSMSYVRVGLTPDGGSTWLLGQRLPRPLVYEWLASGNTIPAARLHELSLINELVEPGSAIAAALERAEKLARGPAFALGAIKSMLGDGQREALVRRQAQEREHFVEALHRDDGGEGITAFLEKRAPQFRDPS